MTDSRSFLQQKTSLVGRNLLQGALAGYKAGPGNALKASWDGRDGSRDVLNRAGWFQLKGWT